jgi:hypothetical protein
MSLPGRKATSANDRSRPEAVVYERPLCGAAKGRRRRGSMTASRSRRAEGGTTPKPFDLESRTRLCGVLGCVAASC